MVNHWDDETVQHGRFRTQRTPARLAQMYSDAIDIPINRTPKGPDATAPQDPIPLNSEPLSSPIAPFPVRAESSIPRRGTRRTADSSSGIESEDNGYQEGSWRGKWDHHAHLITDIGIRVFSVAASEEVGAAATVYDVAKLAEMFPAFAAACRRFSLEEELEAEGLIACSVYALCEPTTASQRHNVYRRIAYEARYDTCTEFPDYLYEAVRATWSFPGEVFRRFLPTHVRQLRQRQ